mmetsp:Transcript_40732/g.132395  ORF Transcript_40732/g.132395 Transcript_40732/m.132395 type:complete len:212 (-) Transcript_40732:23-658(-)
MAVVSDVSPSLSRAFSEPSCHRACAHSWMRQRRRGGRCDSRWLARWQSTSRSGRRTHASWRRRERSRRRPPRRCGRRSSRSAPSPPACGRLARRPPPRPGRPRRRAAAFRPPRWPSSPSPLPPPARCCRCSSLPPRRSTRRRSTRRRSTPAPVVCERRRYTAVPSHFCLLVSRAAEELVPRKRLRRSYSLARVLCVEMVQVGSGERGAMQN